MKSVVGMRCAWKKVVGPGAIRAPNCVCVCCVCVCVVYNVCMCWRVCVCVRVWIERSMNLKRKRGRFERKKRKGKRIITWPIVIYGSLPCWWNIKPNSESSECAVVIVCNHFLLAWCVLGLNPQHTTTHTEAFYIPIYPSTYLSIYHKLRATVDGFCTSSSLYSCSSIFFIAFCIYVFGNIVFFVPLKMDVKVHLFARDSCW